MKKERFLCWIFLLGCTGSLWAGNPEESFYPKGTPLTSLVVIPESKTGNFVERVLVATLQGVVAKYSHEQIYILAGGGYRNWKDWLCGGSLKYGIKEEQVSSPWDLVDKFRSYLQGYILYDVTGNPDSLNAATSLCGIFHAIAVDRSIEAQAHAHGITNRLFDVSNWTEKDVWNKYHHLFNPSLVVEQKEMFNMQLRDYAVLARAFTFYDGNTSFRQEVLKDLQPDSRVLGWGEASHGEDQFVGPGSEAGVSTIAADWALNLAPLSSIYNVDLFQRVSKEPMVESNVHYVTFVVTDGDNVQWNLGGFADYYNNPNRGKFDMGWAISPSLIDLAPAVVDWYYSHASTSPHQDFFIVGPSGDGYFYPSRYPKEELQHHVQRLNSLMTRGDLNIVQILDFNSFNRTDLWNLYLSQPHIDALFYMEYARYDALHGRMLFCNHKPVIAIRGMLWKGMQGADEDSIIQLLNNAVRDPYRPEGYSVIAVHVWSMNLDNVKAVVDRLDPHVRVVSPNALVKLIQKTLGRLKFDFSDGLQGWTGGTSGKPYDKAEWTKNEGQGALVLDGSDLGHPDNQPNAWFSRTLYLPNDALTLQFRTRALNDGRLRVRLQTVPTGSPVLLMDWDTPTDQKWKKYEIDIKDFAGKTVILFFEQNDGGQGVGEYRFVDDIKILRKQDATTLPSPPQFTGTEVSTNSVTLFWKPADIEEDGYKVERRKIPYGSWQPIGQISSHTLSFKDTQIIPGHSYLYRVRAIREGSSSLPSLPILVNVPKACLLAGSPWKYYSRTFYPGSGWYLPEFNDQSWPIGRAPLGYGNEEAVTIVRKDSDPKYITTYFRQRFYVEEPRRIRTLIGHLLRDDGAVVYVNGQEVFRNNLPETRILPTTLATQTVEGEEEKQWIAFVVDPQTLVPGWNVVAVEVHQSQPHDSDMIFALDLIASFLPPSPPLQIQSAGDRLRISWPSWAHDFRLESSPQLGEGASWASVSDPVHSQGDHVYVEVAPEFTQRFFRLICP